MMPTTEAATGVGVGFGITPAFNAEVVYAIPAQNRDDTCIENQAVERCVRDCVDACVDAEDVMHGLLQQVDSADHDDFLNEKVNDLDHHNGYCEEDQDISFSLLTMQPGKHEMISTAKHENEETQAILTTENKEVSCTLNSQAICGDKSVAPTCNCEDEKCIEIAKDSESCKKYDSGQFTDKTFDSNQQGCVINVVHDIVHSVSVQVDAQIELTRQNCVKDLMHDLIKNVSKNSENDSHIKDEEKCGVELCISNLLSEIVNEVSEDASVFATTEMVQDFEATIKEVVTSLVESVSLKCQVTDAQKENKNSCDNVGEATDDLIDLNSVNIDDPPSEEAELFKIVSKQCLDDLVNDMISKVCESVLVSEGGEIEKKESVIQNEDLSSMHQQESEMSECVATIIPLINSRVFCSNKIKSIDNSCSPVCNVNNTETIPGRSKEGMPEEISKTEESSCKNIDLNKPAIDAHHVDCTVNTVAQESDNIDLSPIVVATNTAIDPDEICDSNINLITSEQHTSVATNKTEHSTTVIITSDANANKHLDDIPGNKYSSESDNSTWPSVIENVSRDHADSEKGFLNNNKESVSLESEQGNNDEMESRDSVHIFNDSDIKLCLSDMCDVVDSIENVLDKTVSSVTKESTENQDEVVENIVSDNGIALPHSPALVKKSSASPSKKCYQPKTKRKRGMKKKRGKASKKKIVTKNPTVTPSISVQVPVLPSVHDKPFNTLKSPSYSSVRKVPTRIQNSQNKTAVSEQIEVLDLRTRNRRSEIEREKSIDMSNKIKPIQRISKKGLSRVFRNVICHGEVPSDFVLKVPTVRRIRSVANNTNLHPDLPIAENKVCPPKKKRQGNVPKVMPQPPSHTEKYIFQIEDYHHSINEKGLKIYTCDICLGVYQRSFSLKRHYLRAHINYNHLTERDISNCGIVIGDKTTVQSGNKAVKSKQNRRTVNSRNTIDSKETKNCNKSLKDLYRCYSCGIGFDLKHVLKEHLQNHPSPDSSSSTNKPYSCLHCPATFTHKNNFLKHQSFHAHLSTSSCSSTSSSSFSSASSAVAYPCSYCYKAFSSSAVRKRHVQQHEAAPSNTCMFLCGKSFSNLNELRSHLINLHGAEYLGCLKCEERFLDASSLDEHTSSQHCLPKKEIANPIISLSKELNKGEVTINIVSDDNDGVKPTNCVSVSINKRKQEDKRKLTQKNVASSEQANGDFRYTCTVCSKMFTNYVNMCRHRRLAHGTVGKHKKSNKSSDSVISEQSSSRSQSPVPCIPNGNQSQDDSQSVMSEPPILVRVETVQANTEADGVYPTKVSCNIRDNLLNYLDGKINQVPSGKEIEKALRGKELERSLRTVALTPELTITALPLSDDQETSSFDENSESQDSTSADDVIAQHSHRLSWEKYSFPKNYNGRCVETFAMEDMSHMDLTTQLAMKQRASEKQLEMENKLPEEEDNNSIFLKQELALIKTSQICPAYRVIIQLEKEMNELVGIEMNKKFPEKKTFEDDRKILQTESGILIEQVDETDVNEKSNSIDIEDKEDKTKKMEEVTTVKGQEIDVAEEKGEGLEPPVATLAIEIEDKSDDAMEEEVNDTDKEKVNGADKDKVKDAEEVSMVKDTEMDIEEKVENLKEVTEKGEVNDTEEVADKKEAKESEEIVANKREINCIEEVAEKREVNITEEIAEKREVNDIEEGTDKREVKGTEEVAENREVSCTEEVADKREVKGTEEVAENREVSCTEEVADKREVKGTEEVAENREVSCTEEVTDKRKVKGTEEVAENREVSCTEEVADKREVKGTEEVTDKREVKESEEVIVVKEVDIKDVGYKEVIKVTKEVKDLEVLTLKGELGDTEDVKDMEELDSETKNTEQSESFVQCISHIINDTEEIRDHRALSGDWIRPRSYICCTCADKFSDLWELEDHMTTAHRNVWCTFLELDASTPVPGDLFHRSLEAGGVLGSATVIPPTPAAESSCTKCGRTSHTLPELHRHMLECGGDYTWMINSPSRRKNKWRPFGSRKRRQQGRRGMKRNIPNSPVKFHRGRLRGADSASDSIQRMIANLPAKRATRRVIQFTDDEIKTRSQATINNVSFSSPFPRLSLKASKASSSKQFRRGRPKSITAVKKSDVEAPPPAIHSSEEIKMQRKLDESNELKVVSSKQNKESEDSIKSSGKRKKIQDKEAGESGKKSRSIKEEIEERGVKRHLFPGEPPFICKGCGTEFDNSSACERHVKKCVYRHLFQDDTTVKSSGNKQSHQCTNCKKIFSSPSILEKHSHSCVENNKLADLDMPTLQKIEPIKVNRTKKSPKSIPVLSPVNKLPINTIKLDILNLKKKSKVIRKCIFPESLLPPALAPAQSGSVNKQVHTIGQEKFQLLDSKKLRDKKFGVKRQENAAIKIKKTTIFKNKKVKLVKQNKKNDIPANPIKLEEHTTSMEFVDGRKKKGVQARNSLRVTNQANNLTLNVTDGKRQNLKHKKTSVKKTTKVKYNKNKNIITQEIKREATDLVEIVPDMPRKANDLTTLKNKKKTAIQSESNKLKKVKKLNSGTKEAVPEKAALTNGVIVKKEVEIAETSNTKIKKQRGKRKLGSSTDQDPTSSVCIENRSFISTDSSLTDIIETRDQPISFPYTDNSVTRTDTSSQNKAAKNMSKGKKKKVVHSVQENIVDAVEPMEYEQVTNKIFTLQNQKRKRGRIAVINKPTPISKKHNTVLKKEKRKIEEIVIESSKKRVKSDSAKEIESKNAEMKNEIAVNCNGSLDQSDEEEKSQETETSDAKPLPQEMQVSDDTPQDNSFWCDVCLKHYSSAFNLLKHRSSLKHKRNVHGKDTELATVADDETMHQGDEFPKLHSELQGDVKTEPVESSGIYDASKTNTTVPSPLVPPIPTGKQNQLKTLKQPRRLKRRRRRKIKLKKVLEESKVNEETERKGKSINLEPDLIKNEIDKGEGSTEGENETIVEAVEEDNDITSALSPSPSVGNSELSTCQDVEEVPKIINDDVNNDDVNNDDVNNDDVNNDDVNNDDVNNDHVLIHVKSDSFCDKIGEINGIQNKKSLENSAAVNLMTPCTPISSTDVFTLPDKTFDKHGMSKNYVDITMNTNTSTCKDITESVSLCCALPVVNKVLPVNQPTPASDTPTYHNYSSQYPYNWPATSSNVTPESILPDNDQWAFNNWNSSSSEWTPQTSNQGNSWSGGSTETYYPTSNSLPSSSDRAQAPQNSSFGAILGSVHQVLDDGASEYASSEYSVNGQQSHDSSSPFLMDQFGGRQSLEEIQRAMGATDEEMDMLQQLGQGSLTSHEFVYDNNATQSGFGEGDILQPLDNPDLIDLDNQANNFENSSPHTSNHQINISQDEHMTDSRVASSSECGSPQPPALMSQSTKLLSIYEKKEMVCPICNRHFLGLQALETHISWVHKMKDAKKRIFDKKENAHGRSAIAAGYSSLLGREPGILVGSAAGVVLGSAGGIRGGVLRAAAGAAAEAAEEAASKKRKLACFVCKELYSDVIALNRHIAQLHIKKKDVDRDGGLKSQMSSALGGLLDRALSNMLGKAGRNSNQNLGVLNKLGILPPVGDKLVMDEANAITSSPSSPCVSEQNDKEIEIPAVPLDPPPCAPSIVDASATTAAEEVSAQTMLMQPTPTITPISVEKLTDTTCSTIKEEPEETQTTDMELESQIVVCEQENVFICSYCGDRFMKDSSRKRHISKVHREAAQSSQCPSSASSDWSADTESESEHVPQSAPEHMTLSQSIDPILPEPPSDELQCPVCMASMKHYHSLCRHLKTQHCEWNVQTFSTDMYHYLIIKKDSPFEVIRKKYSIYIPAPRGATSNQSSAERMLPDGEVEIDMADLFKGRRSNRSSVVSPSPEMARPTVDLSLTDHDAIRAKAFAALRQLNQRPSRSGGVETVPIRGSKRRPLDIYEFFEDEDLESTSLRNMSASDISKVLSKKKKRKDSKEPKDHKFECKNCSKTYKSLQAFWRHTQGPCKKILFQESSSDNEGEMEINPDVLHENDKTLLVESSTNVDDDINMESHS